MDCSGHGTCFYEDGMAKCECDEGFADDGTRLCGKCEDQLFQYPYCGGGVVRNWMIEQTSHECDKLPTRMPVWLYKDDSYSRPEDPVYQSAVDGHLVWYGVYRL